VRGSAGGAVGAGSGAARGVRRSLARRALCSNASASIAVIIATTRFSLIKAIRQLAFVPREGGGEAYDQPLCLAYDIVLNSL
jgi:hypothetical protein